jgi:hypothetical protein
MSPCIQYTYNEGAGMSNLSATAKRHAGAMRLWLLVALCALVGMGMAASAAQAETYLTKYRAERAAKHFVANRYADTYTWNLTAYCQPRLRPYDPSYMHRVWNCGWYDVSDDTSGVVRIVGRPGRGYYSGRVIR